MVGVGLVWFGQGWAGLDWTGLSRGGVLEERSKNHADRRQREDISTE